MIQANQGTNNSNWLAAGLGNISGLICLALLLAGCPQVQPGTGSSTPTPAVQSSNTSPASTSASAVSTEAPKLDRSVGSELPLDSSYTIETISGELSTGLEVRALSGMDALGSATQILGALGNLGYESDDNASRILEGVTFSKQGGRVHSLFVKVDLGSDDICRVTLRAYK